MIFIRGYQHFPWIFYMFHHSRIALVSSTYISRETLGRAPKKNLDFCRDFSVGHIMLLLQVMEVIMFETEDLVSQKNEKHVVLTLLEVQCFSNETSFCSEMFAGAWTQRILVSVIIFSNGMIDSWDKRESRKGFGRYRLSYLLHYMLYLSISLHTSSWDDIFRTFFVNFPCRIWGIWNIKIMIE